MAVESRPTKTDIKSDSSRYCWWPGGCWDWSSWTLSKTFAESGDRELSTCVELTFSRLCVDRKRHVVVVVVFRVDKTRRVYQYVRYLFQHHRQHLTW